MFALPASLAVAPIASAEEGRPGYSDTPMHPTGKWRVHDQNRPYPVRVKVARQKGRPVPPPADAEVLFGKGTKLKKWFHEDGKPASWTVRKGFFQVKPKTGRIQTSETFKDVQLHLEWASP